jgi:hypothetical protein
MAEQWDTHPGEQDGSLREPVVAEWHCGMIISLHYDF